MASLDSSRAETALAPELDIDREVALMRQMTVDQLRRKFAEVFQEETRSRHRDWLIKRIAWRMQANVYGGLSERALSRAAELAANAEIRTTAPRKRKIPEVGEPAKTVGRLDSCDKRLPPPGNTLVRVYKGQTIEVKVLPSGFEFEGTVYKSLSAVAKTITGTHCSGYLFFRLTQNGGDR